LACTHIGADQLGTSRQIRWAKPIYDAFLAGCWTIQFTEDSLLWAAKPAVHVEEMPGGWRRAHNESSAAIESDIERLYFVHGVLVPAFVVVRPDWITLRHIQQEQNTEVRRVMLERFGYERYVREIGAKCVDAMDSVRLFRVARPDDSDLVMVELTNSTPEPDGHFKVYFERVHPELRPYRRRRDGTVWLGEPQDDRAINAVASRFGLYGHEYRPMVET